MENLTEFEKETAKQLATERGHKTPTDSDIADAVALAKGWNCQRAALALPLWK